MDSLRALIARVARSQAPVHISGESGTGKELVARLIHSSGARREGPFIPVNCGAIPTELMESELFGYKRGSFSGAVSDKLGLVQSAEGGTLFLDEVADLPLHMQVKLLRVIQEKTVRPLGEQHEQPIDVRVLSATHKNLAALVAGRQVPRGSLLPRQRHRYPRARTARSCQRHPRAGRGTAAAVSVAAWAAEAPTLGAEALAALQGYAFPGNVRELENILERALTLCTGERINVEDLQLRAATGSAPQEVRLRGTPPPPCPPWLPAARHWAISSSISSATPYSRPWSRPATTRPRRRGCSALPSGRCATRSRSSASNSRARASRPVTQRVSS